MLHTLGGLGLHGEVRQPRLLLLLAYLALEGATPRRSLALVFWPGATRPLSNLSVALSTLRQALPAVVDADSKLVRVRLDTDLQAFLKALESNDEALAAALYRGPFLLGCDEPGLGTELEEWILSTREFTAERYRSALLQWAGMRTDGTSGRLADAAYRVAGAPPPDGGTLARLHTVLTAADHPSRFDVALEAAEFGLQLPVVDHAPTTDRHAPGAGNFHGRGSDNSTPHSDDSAADPEALPQLPTPPHALIGREPERLEVHRLLTEDGARLVTLHGPGGIGKTSLALQVAHELHASHVGAFPGGVAFVGLEDTRDAFELPYAIATALGRTPPSGREAAESVRAVLPAERILLVLDNLEQVRGAPELLMRILDESPQLQLLSTSRELLGLRREVAFALDGLAVPASHDTAQAASYDAIRLFHQVARRADAHFQLSAAALPHVSSICRAVGGSPLGILLAAAWVRAVPLAELAREVEADVELLRSARTPGPARHASARASFERSWQRLASPQRRALAGLSAFSGGFRLDDAVAVADVSIPVLARLADAAVLRLGPDGRYQQHPLVWRFAREKLAASGAREAEVLRRHARCVLLAVATGADDLRRLRGTTLVRFDEEFDNVRAAWQHAVSTLAADLISAAALPLMGYVDARARLLEGGALFTAAAAAAWRSDPEGVRAKGRSLAATAWVEARLGNQVEAIAAGTTAVVLLEGAGDAAGARVAGHALASAHYRAGEYAKARALFERLVEDSADDPLYRAELLGRLGLVAQAVGEYDSARGSYLESLAGHRGHANVRGVVTQLLNLGALELNSTAPERAVSYLEEGLTLAREHGYEQVIPVLLHNLANVACKAGRHEESRSMARDALRRVIASGERGLESGMLATLGWIELEAGDLDEAEAQARRALDVASEIGDEPAEQTARVRLAQALLARDHIEDAVALLDAAEEHPATLTWARRLATRLRESAAN